MGVQAGWILRGGCEANRLTFQWLIIALEQIQNPGIHPFSPHVIRGLICRAG